MSEQSATAQLIKLARAEQKKPGTVVTADVVRLPYLDLVTAVMSLLPHIDTSAVPAETVLGECVGCGTAFEPKHQRQYCSDKCRHRVKRVRQRGGAG